MLCAAAAEVERGEARNEARDERENARNERERREKVNGREEEKDVWRSWHGEVPCAAAERRNVRWEMIGRTTTHTFMAILQMQHRQYSTELPLQGNYYPVSCAAFIEDRHQRLTLLTQQAHGFSSLTSGVRVYVHCTRV